MSERMFAVVKGQVQGVNFRYYTQQSAQQLGLAGYVRNLPDGSVEVLAEGKRPALESLISFLHEGSPSSQVESVEVKWSDGDGSLREFVIRS